MRQKPSPRNFRSGELAPWLDGITDELTAAGCRTLENFIARKQGAAVRRPGTRFLGEVKDSTKATILVPVEIDEDNIYILEVGDAYIRVWDQSTHARAGSSYEITSPWSAADVSDLNWQYIPSEKAVFWTHSLYAMRQLTFVSAANWTLEQAQIVTHTSLLVVGRTGRIAETDDFIHWKEKTIAITQSTSTALLTSEGATRQGGYFIMDTVTKDRFYISDDGENWLNVCPSGHLIRAAKEDSNKRLIAVGRGATSVNAIFVSNDGGLSWLQLTDVVNSTTNWIQIDYNENRRVFRAISDNAKGMYSFDGYTWVSVTETSGFEGCELAVNDSDIWVTVGPGLGGSVDGKIRKSSSLTSSFVVAYSAPLNERIHGTSFCEPNAVPYWIACGFPESGSVGYVFRSPGESATSWTRNTLCGSGAFPGVVAWIPPKIFIFGRGPDYWTSLDGTTWTTHTETALLLDANDYTNVALFGGFSERETFLSAAHYPTNLTFHEQRLVIGPTVDEPAKIWGSKTGRFNNFYLGELANEAYEYELTGERNINIKWLMGGTELVIGTRTQEIVLRGEQGIGITPGGAQALVQSTFGSAGIQPVRIHDTIVFVQRGGEIIRGFIPAAGKNAWQSPDLTYNADHIADGGVTQLAHQCDPQTILYAVRNDGQLLALTYQPPTSAWARIKPASTSLSVGIIESIAVVPTGSAEDEIWCIVKRVVDAGTKRYIEYFDTLNVGSLASAHYVDCGVNPTSGTTFAIVGGLTHIAGENVDTLIDGLRIVSGLTVAASGTITVAPYSGTNIHVGLPYTSYLQTMRADYGSPWGMGGGLNKRASDLMVWVHDSSAVVKFGPTTTTATEEIIYSSSTTLVTEICKVNFPGQYDRDGYIWCIVDKPKPFTLVAMAPDVEQGDR